MAYSSRRKSGAGKLLSRGLLIFALLAGLLVYVLGATNDSRLDPVKRAALDTSAPATEFVSNPFRFIGDAFSDMGAFLDVYETNRKLREDIVQLTQWREVARRFEAENAQLRALHNVTLAPKYDYITAQVIGNSGGGLTHTITVNVGRAGGARPGAVALDGSGVAGRIVALGENASRILLLTDLSSHVPVMIEGTGKKNEDGEEIEIVRAIVVGDNTASPKLEFPTEVERIRPGQRIVTSNDGGIYPKGLTVGVVQRGENGQLRVRVAANFDRLEFVRILLDRTDRSIDADAILIVSPSGDNGRAE